MLILITAILKTFFRNPRAIFFVIFLPAGIFSLSALLGLENIIRADLPVSYTSFLLVGIVAMALMQTGIYTVAYSLIDYRRGQIFKRLSVTPLTAGRFLMAQVIARFFVACLQVIALLLMGIFVFHVRMSGFWVLPFLIFVGSTIFLNFGFLISALARDYEEAAPYTTLIGLPLVFLGDVFFPVKNLPHALAVVADYLPLKPLSAVMRYFLLGINSPDLLREILRLLAWLALLSIVSRYIFEKRVYR